jgi:hypothetical protein
MKGKTRPDKTRQDKTRQDKTKQNKTRQDKTRQDKTRQGKTGQDKTKTRQERRRGVGEALVFVLSPLLFCVFLSQTLAKVTRPPFCRCVFVSSCDERACVCLAIF